MFTYLKETWRLSSLSVLLTMLGIGVVLLHARRLAPWGRRWLTALWLVYWFLSTPIGSTIASAPLVRGWQPIASREQAHGARTIVVLAGGTVSHVAGGMVLDDVAASGLRVVEGARLYSVLDRPSIIVSGGNTGRLNPPRPEAAVCRDGLIKLGVPASNIIVEDTSLTTHEQVLMVKDMLAAAHIRQFVLVTSSVHMLRSLAAFRAVGLDPIPSVSRLRSDPAGPLWTPMPDRQSLDISDEAVYEYLAWVYYRVRGWIRTTRVTAQDGSTR